MAVAATTVIVGRTVTPGTSEVAIVTLDPGTTAISLDFAAATRLYRTRYIGEQIDFGPTRRVVSSDFTYDEFPVDLAGSNGMPYFVRAPITVGASYAGLALWAEPFSGDRMRIRRLLFGSRTVAADLPNSGTSVYGGSAEISERSNLTYQLGAIRGGVISAFSNIQIYWPTRVVTGDIRVAPPSGTGSSLQSPHVYTVSGVVGSDGRLNGTLSDGTTLSGTFEGAVFGPRAREAGFVLRVTGTRSGADANYSGEVIAVSTG